MFGSLPQVTRALLIANVAVYLLQSVVGGRWAVNLALWPPGDALFGGAVGFRPWQLITYSFLHGNFMHIFSNMFGLYMFGPPIERLLGANRFVMYYFACVVGAALTQLVMTPLLDMGGGPMVGASGGIFGLLLAFGLAYPHQRIMLLFPPIPMPAWVFVTLYGVFELVVGVTGTNQGVAHFAHLGGMAAGFVLIFYWRLQKNAALRQAVPSADDAAITSGLLRLVERLVRALEGIVRRVAFAQQRDTA